MTVRWTNLPSNPVGVTFIRREIQERLHTEDMMIGSAVLAGMIGMGAVVPTAITSSNGDGPGSPGTAAGTVVVSSPKYDLNGRPGFTVQIAEVSCPASAPVRSSTEFHPDSGWRIPRGVALVVTDSIGNRLETSKTGVDAFIGASDHSAGGLGSSVSNWSFAQRYLTMNVHCTSI